MLIEFRVKNFRSFRDEQVLSLVASNDKSLPNNCTEVGDLKLLRSAAIYGPNASGKSNLVKALLFMRQFVLTSADTQAGQPIDVARFRLDARCRRETSSFEATFLADGVSYY